MSVVEKPYKSKWKTSSDKQKVVTSPAKTKRSHF